MINQTCNGIINALRKAFPLSKVPVIYTEKVPYGFQRPSFLLELLPWCSMDLTACIREYPISWQVVYFPPRDDAGNEDVENLHDVAIRMDEVFGQAVALPLPDGSLAHITDFSWEELNGVGYATIALSVVFLRMIDDPAP